MASNLARLVARLQIETSKYDAGIAPVSRSARKFAEGLTTAFKSGTDVSINQAVLRELDAKLLGLRDAARGAVLRKAASKGIRSALAKAKETIPVGTVEHRTYKGRLVLPGFAKKNVKVKTFVSQDKQAAAALLGVDSEAFYAVQFLELGTSKMQAKPWLVPAFESTAPEQVAAVTAELKAGIEKAARK
jgi:HK97 gp10 family phage protein